MAFALLFLFATVAAVAVCRREVFARRWRWFEPVIQPLWAFSAGLSTLLVFAEVADAPISRGGWLLAILSLSLVVLPASLWWWRGAHVVTGGVFVLITILAAGDTFNLRFFSDIGQIAMAGRAWQLWDIRNDLFALMEVRDLAYVVLLVASLVWMVGGRFTGTSPQVKGTLAGRENRIGPRSEVPAARSRRIGPFFERSLLRVVMSAACVTVALFVISWVEVEDAPGIERPDHDLERRRDLSAGLVVAHIGEVRENFAERARAEVLEPLQRENVERFIGRHQASTGGSRDGFGIARSSNVLVIQLESFDGWLVGAEVDGREVTPVLNELARTSFFVPRLLDQTAWGRTSDAEYSVLNSLHPLAKGTVAFEYERNRFVTLSGVLRERGYSTFSAHGHKASFWNRRILHPLYGFDRSMFRKDFDPGPQTSWGLADHAFFDQLVGEVGSLPEPYLAFLISLSSHSPYARQSSGLDPDGEPVLDVAELDDSVLGNYLQMAHYVDRSVGRFLRDLEADGLLRNTTVVIYGDHTATAEFDPDSLRRIARVSLDPPAPLPMFTFVPLLISLPEGSLEHDVQPAGTSGGLLDIAPTVLHLLGSESPRSFLGQSLTQARERPLVRWARGVVVQDDLLLVRQRCVDLMDGTPRPRSACRGMRAEGREELEVSNLITQHDLAFELSASARTAEFRR